MYIELKLDRHDEIVHDALACIQRAKHIASLLDVPVGFTYDEIDLEVTPWDRPADVLAYFHAQQEVARNTDHGE